MAPLTNGTDNIDLDPLIDGMTGWLLSSSPCIDAGTNQAWMIDNVDLEGDPRIFNTIVDIGADETFVGATRIQGVHPVASQWKVPKGATCQWQTVTSPTGTWTDLGTTFTTTTTTITFDDTSSSDANNVRVIWEKE